MQVAYEVDVAVIGGGTAAVSAAVAAAGAGATAFLAAPRTFLGEDICGTLRLQDAADLPESFRRGGRVTPLQVKKALDEQLNEAGVHYLFGCYATEPIYDTAEGADALCGFAMAHRAGRQAVLARVIIDATERAWFARAAGARAEAWPGGEQEFERTIVMPGAGGEPEFLTESLAIEMSDRRFSDFARAEQVARDRTYREGQLRSSDQLFQVPPDPIVCAKRASEWTGEPALGHFRPAGIDRLFVLSGSADVPRAAAARLLHPGALMPVGRRLGAEAARQAKQGAPLARPRGREGAVQLPAPEPPVLGRYDVVVVGGGTSGAPAAIGAARQGADVLLLEYQHALGGTATLGLIGRAYHGTKAGFSAEVPFPNNEHNMAHKMEWYRRSVREAGGEVWFGALTCGAWLQDGRVAGVEVATPAGRGVVLADVVIDSTGNADVAAAAGAETLHGATEDGYIAMQGAGLPPWPLGAYYVNTDYLLVDESDVVDLWRALVGARMAMAPGHFDVAPLIQTRERRRIVGDHVLRYIDQVAGRMFPDSVVVSRSDYDSHGYPNADYFALIPHTEASLKANHPAPGGTCYTPYRCLLPRGVEGLLVTGLGISMERDASAMVRMQHDLANQGYAAGVAAAMASEQGVVPRGIDVRALQRHMVEVGSLPADALEQEDSFPRPPERVAEAAGDLLHPDRQRACRALAVVLRQPEDARPHVRAAHEAAEGEQRLFLARVLGFWGEKGVGPELAEALAQSSWDPKILQGGMAEYAHLPTPVDSLVLALARCGHKGAVDAILAKMEKMDAGTTLSHHRSCALALEGLGDGRAAGALARLLRKPGMSGHAMVELEPLHDKPRRKRRREGGLREIILARALYRCGDHEGLARGILEHYRQDLRGLFRRHAEYVLAGKKPGA